MIKFGDIFHSDSLNAKCVVVMVKGNDWYFVAEDYPVVIKSQCAPEHVKWVNNESEDSTN